MKSETDKIKWTINPYSSPVLARTYARLLYPMAWLRRQALTRTTFISITGSLGKTVCRECLYQILVSKYPSFRNIKGDPRYGIPRALRQMRRHHQFGIIEISASRQDWWPRILKLIRPQIAVVTNVMPVHTNKFATLEEIASVKSRLVQALVPTGIAVLNIDDALVASMTPGKDRKVFTYGRAANADLRASDIDSRWPDRLSFTVNYRGQQRRIRTQLVGEHLLEGVLAAIAAALNCDITLEEAADALVSLPPITDRMEPLDLPNGATLFRDTLVNPMCKFQLGLGVIRDARAARKIIVSGEVSDSGMSSSNAIRQVARGVATVADAAVFVGSVGRKAAAEARRAGMPASQVHAFKLQRDAAEFLRSELGRGDLVWLVGRLDDHLARLYFAQIGTIECWVRKCKLPQLCDGCPKLGFKRIG